MLLQIPVPPPPPQGPPFDPNLIWMSDFGPQALVWIVLLSLLATTVILWPIMRALARRIESKAGPDPALRAELEQLQLRVSDLESVQLRVSELEERLDFAERLLTRGPETPADTARSHPS
jgi:Tfp pilus assembly protein PilO